MVLKGDHKPSFNKTLSIAKTEIISLVRQNDNITKLLKYTESDALTNPNCIVNSTIRKEVYSQNNDNCRFHMSKFDVTAAKDVCSEVHAFYSDIKPRDLGAIKIPIMTMYIIVSRAINTLANGDGGRHEYLFQEINDAIEGHYIGANIDGFVPIGCIEFLGAREEFLDGNTHSIYIVQYKIGEIKEWVRDNKR